jgi:hypothetical protein
MPISAPFASEQEADSAYYGTDSGTDSDDGGGGGGGDSGATWGDLQQAASLEAGFVLGYQDQQNGDRTRWFVFRSVEGALEFVNSGGETVEAGENDRLSNLPHYDTEADAREAFAAWQDANGEDDQDQGSAWGNWSKISEEPPWHIYSRSHKQEDRAQFLAAGELEDGSAVYLAPGGEVADEPHTYDSADALTEALRAFYTRSENGEIPEDRRPTGDDPGAETVRNQAGGAGGLLEQVGPKRAAVGAALVVGGYAVYQSDNGGA